MAQAYDYDPDEQFDDDNTGDAQVAQMNSIPGVEDAQEAMADMDDVTGESVAAGASDAGDDGDDATVASNVEAEDPQPLVDPNIQKAIETYIPEAEDTQITTGSTEDQFTTAYDIIDQIDATVADAPTLLFYRNQVRVNHDELHDLLDELKDVLPVQLERASTLMREAERRLGNAQTQADAIVENAQSKAASIIKEANERARFLAGQENVVSLATEQARTILNNAQEKATQLTRGANKYTEDSMRALDDQIVELRRSINTGLQVLQERQRLAEQDMPQLTPEDYPQN